MSENELRESIDRLRAEIDRLAGVDESSRARLESLVADLEQRLESPDDAKEDSDLLADVREAITHFEVEHPTATGVLNHIMVTLANMGI